MPVILDTDDVAKNAETGEVATLARRAADTGYRQVSVGLWEDDGGGFGWQVSPVVKAAPEFPTSVMVALYPDPDEAAALAVAGGLDPEDLHVTLAFLGDIETMSPRDLAVLHAIVADHAQWSRPLEGQVSGLGVFDDTGDGFPVYGAVDVPGLGRFRADLVDKLNADDLTVSTSHDFTPHMTLTYQPAPEDGSPVPLPPIPDGRLSFRSVAVVVGGSRTGYQLGAALEDVQEPQRVVRSARPGVWDRLRDLVTGGSDTGSPPEGPSTMQKRAADRFTLGPWYIPDRSDAHGEWSDADELQKALWAYVDRNDREIRLQHDNDVRAGRWVEAMSWPYPVEVDVTIDGKVRKATYPAGTVFLGVVWDEWAWPGVEKGLIRGYSIGGTARRMTVDLPTEAA